MIFWFSNIYDYKMLSSNKKLSPASSYWQLRLIEALKKNKKKILIYSYYIQDYWPLNDFFINNKCKKSIHYLKFINLPIIKKYYLYNQYKKIFIKFHKKNNIIFTYNFDKIIIKLVNELKKKFNFKWYSIVADFNDKEIDNINNQLEKSDKVIILSKSAEKKILNKNKILFHGGIVKKKITKFKEKKGKTFFYSGSTDNWTNFKKFILDFKKIKDKKIKLKFTSQYVSKDVREAISTDKRIKYLGFLNEQKLNYYIKNSEIFLSLRNLKNKNNFNNFPSKILKYLEYGKLIFSDDNKSCSNDLKKALIINKSNNYLSQIKFISQNYKNVYLKKLEKIKKIQFNLNWDIQIKRLFG